MVIDSSAIVAILFGEPEADSFAHAIESDAIRLIATPTLLETAIVVEYQLEEDGSRELDLFIHTVNIELIPFGVDHYQVARNAFRRYGKGRHPAGLNYGDCFSYALSQTSGEPLLYKGTDFARTDIQTVDTV
jgi:ribonuclease VapC